MKITSERQAWEAVARYASHITGNARNQEARIALEGIADNMLRQLGKGVHRNPTRPIYESPSGRYWIAMTSNGTYDVYKVGATASERVAQFGFTGEAGLQRARDFIDRREGVTH